MKEIIVGLVAFIALYLFFACGIFEGVAKLICWLFSLKLTESNVTMSEEFFVKITSFIVSYLSVGIIFSRFGWFDSGAMKLVYFVISTVVSFALCNVVTLIETNLLHMELNEVLSI